MEVASIFATRSTCSRAHVGVVIAREGRILTTGYNGAPAGMDHCNHSNDCNVYHDEKAHLELYGTLGKPPDSGCKVSVHAEANAIAYAARYGISLEGAELFSTFMPCLPCAQLIINSGITRIFVKHLYRDKAGGKLLGNAKIDIIIL